MTLYDSDIAYDSDIPYDGAEAAGSASATLTAFYPAPTYPRRPKPEPEPAAITGHGGIATMAAPQQFISVSVRTSFIEPIVARCQLSSPANGFFARGTVDNSLPRQIRAEDDEIVQIVAALLMEESIRESAAPQFETSYKVTSSIVP